jgi:hypothetical protein
MGETMIRETAPSTATALKLIVVASGFAVIAIGGGV